jgi:hypothetical protein
MSELLANDLRTQYDRAFRTIREIVAAFPEDRWLEPHGDIYYIPCRIAYHLTVVVDSYVNGGFKDKINGDWYYYVLIRIPITMPAAGNYNFSSFSIGNIYNTAGSGNIDSSYSNLGNYTETGYVHGPYNGYATVKLYLTNRDAGFVANLTTVVDGHCNVHYLPYSTTKTDVVSGMWS